MSEVSEHAPAQGGSDADDDTQQPAGGTWGMVALFVGFVVVMSGCITLQILS